VTSRAAKSKSNDFDTLSRMAGDIRRLTLEMTSRAKSSHVGSVFSAAEILSALYGKVLNVRPDQPDWEGRDRFVLSKGHSCAGLYAVLALRGFFPRKRLEEFYVDGGSLYGHATHKGVPGVEVSSGSLGHGLAIATGLASGAKRLGFPWRVFALLSDGECDEGSTWEAALLAPAWKLNNLIAIVDYNKIQSLGRVDEVLPLEPFADKWAAFGWDVCSIDGHDIGAVVQALVPVRRGPTDRPRCVIAHTVKGKGVSFMEDTLLWHYRSPQGEELERALLELGE
jgi:transketolase